MNQNLNNLNQNNFNQQANNGIPNNQPLNNQNFNQQQGVMPNIVQQPDEQINTQININNPHQNIEQTVQTTHSFHQPINNNYTFNNVQKKGKNKKGFIIGIAGIIIAIIVIISILFITQNKKSEKPTDAVDSVAQDSIDSVVQIVETPHGNFYLKENIRDFVVQLYDYKTVPEALGLGNFDEILKYNSHEISFFDKDDFMAGKPILKIDIESEKENSKLGDYKITSFNILEGTIKLKNGSIEIGKTKIDEVKKMLGENNITKQQSDFYQFTLNEYKWNIVWVYCFDDVVANVVVFFD